MSVEEIITLAKLPSRETLIGMLAGALLGNISKLAVALNEVKAQKEEISENCKLKCQGCGAARFGGGICFEPRTEG